MAPAPQVTALHNYEGATYATRRGAIRKAEQVCDGNASSNVRYVIAETVDGRYHPVFFGFGTNIQLAINFAHQGVMVVN